MFPFGKINGAQLRRSEELLNTKAFRTSLLALSLCLTSSALWAQSGNYVVAAHMETSITHQLWPDVFLNGHKVIDSAAHLFDPKSHISQDFSNQELCYFLADNCLALQVDQTLATSAGTGATMGLAFFLKISLSDGSVVWITSDDNQIRQDHVADGGPEPGGWAGNDFSDASWSAVEFYTPTSMGTTLINPQTASMSKYIPLWLDKTTANAPLDSRGEHYYFRRKFSMDIITRPGCVAPRDNKPRPTATETFTPRPTATLRPTSTPRPRATMTYTPLPTHTPVPPKPTATSKPVVHKAKATATATEVWTDTPVPAAPTATPKPRRKKPTSTPTDIPEVPTATLPPLAKPTKFVYVPPAPTHTPVPVRRKKPTATPTAQKPRPTFTPLPPQQEMGMAATIVFVNPPVNIDASFADGPGRYKLEIEDADGVHVITLYDRHVGFEKETWLSWDGTNDQGRLMHYGQYFAYFTKDGVLIQKIALTWIPPGKNEGSAQ
jgi:hypothetical protein